MINPQELRIGNWVSFNGEMIQTTVNTLQLLSIEKPKRELHYAPIPLTPEIMDRIFGPVTEIDGTPCWFNGADIVIRKSDLELYSHNEVDGKMWHIKKVKYVHQLQNITFELCGARHEIKIRLTDLTEPAKA